MYAKTLKMVELLEIINQDTFTLDWVSQETIDAMVKKWLLVEIPFYSNEQYKKDKKDLKRAMPIFNSWGL